MDVVPPQIGQKGDFPQAQHNSTFALFVFDDLSPVKEVDPMFVSIYFGHNNGISPSEASLFNLFA